MPYTAERTRNASKVTLADLLQRLGNVSAERIPLDPPPGKATESDVLWYLDHENRLFELADGVLVEKMMGFQESALAVRLGRFLDAFADAQDLGVVAGADGALRLFQGLVRIPDVSFMSWRKLPKRTLPTEPIPLLVPDLAVEVLSEGNTDEEMKRKLTDYFTAGVQVVWLIDPENRTASIYLSREHFTLLQERDTLDGGSVLPGFRLPLKTLFARLARPAKKVRRKKSNGKNGK